MNILDNFRVRNEKENLAKVTETIENGIDFRGTNLWILIFAIFIASLGLNVNSTAVIIGAMLVSPLMGPIMGMGFGMAIHSTAMLRRSFYSYLFATGVSLATSTVFFLISPINEAHSEILARTSPNIYDVMIALFGGLAGTLALSSKLKGNVLPGVAIATALMPPLCTAGYGLATLKAHFFFGAFYLFMINSVFIALATQITTRLLHFSSRVRQGHLINRPTDKFVLLIVIATLAPSIYFGYDMVQQIRFTRQANLFIEKEAIFPNDYLLRKNIDPKKRTITLTFGGDIIPEEEIEKRRERLDIYGLAKAKLFINQGFSYLQNDNQKDEKLSTALQEKDRQLQNFMRQADTAKNRELLAKQVFLELKAQYPGIRSLILDQTIKNTDSTRDIVWVCEVGASEKIPEKETSRLLEWLKVRVNTNALHLRIELESQAPVNASAQAGKSNRRASR